MPETRTLFDQAKEFITRGVAAQRAIDNIVAPLSHSPKSQCDRILAHLKKGNTLTSLEALRLFNCWNLKGRIWDLRNLNYDHPNIQKRWLTVSSGKRVAQYFLNGE